MGNPELKVHVADGVKLKDQSLVAKEPEEYKKSPFDFKLKSSYQLDDFINQIDALNVPLKATLPLKKEYNKDNTKKSGVVSVEISSKDYTDQRIDSLEKSIDHRFDSTEKLLSEKIEHLTSRLEGAINNQNIKMDGKIDNLTTTIGGKIDLLNSEMERKTESKLNQFKTELINSQKSSRNNVIGWVLSGVAILVAIGIAIAQNLFS